MTLTQMVSRLFTRRENLLNRKLVTEAVSFNLHGIDTEEDEQDVFEDSDNEGGVPL
jgi:hypothetical protein